MESHQLHLIQLFIRFAALHHVAQGKAGDHRVRVIGSSISLPSSISVIQVNSWLTFFMRISAAFGLGEVSYSRFVVDPANQIAHGVDRLSFGQLLDLA